MKTSNIIYLLFVFCGCFGPQASGLVRFTNIECQSHDKDFIQIKLCRLKAVGRNQIALNTYVKLMQKPIDNITVNAQFFRKSMDYRPFLYNATGNFCKFVKYPKKYLFWKILLDLVTPFSNINHTCPYDHDLIVENLILNENFIELIPFPPSDYMIRIKIYFYNSLKFSFKIYMLIK